MNPLSDLRGIVTVLNVPFDASDRVDPDALGRNVEEAIRAGVVGFLVPAMASEVGRLSEGERDDVVRAVVGRAAGRVAVVGGASAPDRPSRDRLARRCLDLGCDGVLASIPYADDAGYAEDARALAAVRPPFLMLQDWDAAGYGVPVATIARLFEEIDAFRSLKIEVVPAGAKYTEVREATGGRLHLAGGWAVAQAIEALDRGVHALMPTAMHAIYVRIHALHSAGRRDEARALHERLLPILAFSNQHLDVSIRFFKRLLRRKGIYPTDRVREPLLRFDAFHERIADELIERAIALEAEVSGSPL